MYPFASNFVAFSIRENLAPKHLFVCCLWGKEDMINEYSWTSVWKTWLTNTVENTRISKKLELLEVKYEMQFSDIEYETLNYLTI